MEFVFNDLAFNYCKSNKYELFKIVEQFVKTILQLEQNRVKPILLSDVPLKGIKLCDGYYIEQLYNEKELKQDIKRVILRVLTKMKFVDVNMNCEFEINDIRSKLCAWTFENERMVISLDMDDSINKEFLHGKLRTNKDILQIKIPNLCYETHIDMHRDLLSIRIYEENPKHKVGYGWGSPMDLSSSIAQSVLNEAIIYANSINCLVNKYNGNFYVFRKHINNCYHGYIDNAVPENIRLKFD